MLPAWLPLLAAGALLWPVTGLAQQTSSLYDIVPTIPAAAPDSGAASVPSRFGLASLRIAPGLQAGGPSLASGGLSLLIGQNWYAQAALGHGLAESNGVGLQPANTDLISLGGGYRWADGQSLTMQLMRDTRRQRLGLAVSYDWPRYFLRLDLDSRLNLAPTDTLRFSAGVRF